jgi:uncharacterized membrane protein YdjX (TVP38/TMEM64 family)
MTETVAEPAKIDLATPPARRRGLLGMLRRLGPAGPIAVAVTVLPPLGLIVLITLCAATGFPTWLRENPGPGLPLYTLAFWVVGICFVPTNAYSTLGGWCFGFGPGFVAAMLGYVGASLISYTIMLRVSRGHVLALVREYPKLDAVRRALLESSPLRTQFIVALLRISPASPFAISNFALASSGVSWRDFLVGTAIGMVPRTLAVVYVASTLVSLDFKDAKEWWMVAPGFAATAAVFGIITWLARRELNRVTRMEEGRGTRD